MAVATPISLVVLSKVEYKPIELSVNGSVMSLLLNEPEMIKLSVSFSKRTDEVSMMFAVLLKLTRFLISFAVLNQVVS